MGSNVANRLTTLERELREAKEEVARLTGDAGRGVLCVVGQHARRIQDGTADNERLKAENARLTKELAERRENDATLHGQIAARTEEYRLVAAENARHRKERAACEPLLEWVRVLEGLSDSVELHEQFEGDGIDAEWVAARNAREEVERTRDEWAKADYAAVHRG